jgi:hypothetical protein
MRKRALFIGSVHLHEWLKNSQGNEADHVGKTFGYFGILAISVVDPDSLNPNSDTDPNPAFHVNPDPDPGFLVARCHSFHLFYINRADIQYFIYTTRRASLLLSSLLSAR